VPREGYRVGLPKAGEWVELLNTDSTYYSGAGVGNMGKVTAQAPGCHGEPFGATLTLPPLAVVWLRPEG
jgi:1,4-alpha-glucan branching enzyme